VAAWLPELLSGNRRDIPPKARVIPPRHLRWRRTHGMNVLSFLIVGLALSRGRRCAPHLRIVPVVLFTTRSAPVCALGASGELVNTLSGVATTLCGGVAMNGLPGPTIAGGRFLVSSSISPYVRRSYLTGGAPASVEETDAGGSCAEAIDGSCTASSQHPGRPVEGTALSGPRRRLLSCDWFRNSPHQPSRNRPDHDALPARKKN